jgi:predicted Rossmann fold nucleotide-binding protein DprA/Smf involved in DNA uptake
VEDSAAEPAGSEEEERILRRLSPVDPLTLDELAEQTGMEAGPLLAALLQLEVEDRVRQLPGGRFTRKRRGNVVQIARHRGIAGQGENHQ